MKKKTHSGHLPDKTVHQEAAADFAERQRLADEAAMLELRQAAEHLATDERLTGDADTNWDEVTDSALAFPGHVATVDVDEVDALGKAAGLTYADDEPLNYDKVAARDEDRWELNPASAVDAPPPVDDDDEANDDEANDDDEEDDDFVDDDDEEENDEEED